MKLLQKSIGRKVGREVGRHTECGVYMNTKVWIPAGLAYQLFLFLFLLVS